MDHPAPDRLHSGFMVTMGHELRTPLNSIIGFTELLLDGLAGPLTEDQRRYAQIIHGSGQQLLQLISDILDLSKLEAGLIEVYGEKVLIRDEIDRIVKEHGGPIGEKGLTVTVKVDENLDWFLCDRKRFEQVLGNLVSNAVKFTEKGSVTIEVQPVQNKLQFSVTDTGIGIAETNLPHIFDEFWQSDSSLTRKYQGTGLGLALTKKMLALLHGEIRVESREDAGSCFTFELPYVRPETTVPAELPVEPPSTQPVLIVDDNQLAADLIATWLREAGYSAIIAPSGEEALRLAQEVKPIAITLDVLLPQMDGWQVLHRLKQWEATKDIPIIICSIIDNKEFGLSLGAVDYMVKPVSRQMLLESLRSATQIHSNTRKILVIDDNPNDVALVEEILRTEGFEVIKAYGGVEGLKKARAENPDLIMLDMLMPDLDGFDVMKLLRSNDATNNLPIVVFTAKELSPAERETLNSHIQGLVEKAKLEKETFIKMITRTLRTIQRQGENHGKT